MTKILGSLCILGAAFSGCWHQRGERRRQRETRLDILAALRRMGEEIRLARTPLPYLLEVTAAECGTQGAAFLRGAARAAGAGESLSEAWTSGVRALPLTAEEQRALVELGGALGGDEKCLCRAISLAAAVLQRRAQEAEGRRAEEEKRAAVLWASAGGLLVILLI